MQTAPPLRRRVERNESLERQRLPQADGEDVNARERKGGLVYCHTC